MTAKEQLVDELYNRLDAGLGKRDAQPLADLIEALIDERIGMVFNQKAAVEARSQPK